MKLSSLSVSVRCRVALGLRSRSKEVSCESLCFRGIDRLDALELSVKGSKPGDIVALSAIGPRSTQTYSPIEFSEGTHVIVVKSLKGFTPTVILPKNFSSPKEEARISIFLSHLSKT